VVFGAGGEALGTAISKPSPNFAGGIAAAVKKRIFSIVRNQEDTEDVLQDTLLRAYVFKTEMVSGQ
jgi:hypothetical protein